MARGEYKPIDWCCLSNLQSPSIFAAILDSETGDTFRIQPTGSYDAVQRYQPDTNVLERSLQPTREHSVEFEVTFEPRFSLNTAFALEIDGISARGSTTSRPATPPGTPSSTASASDPSRSIPNSCSIGLAGTGATGYTPVRNPGVRSRVSTTTR